VDFSKIKLPVAAQFAKMAKGELFRTNTPKDKMWSTYLGSFPEGSNPIFRERTEYDCNCCKNFIRAVGNVVSIVDGRLESIWDVVVDEPAYQAVADALSDLVKTETIDNTFLHTEKNAGTNKTYEEIMNSIKTWDHFYVEIPQNFVMAGKDIGPKHAEMRATHDVFLRGLAELTTGSVDTVLDLIKENALYRGEEHKFVLTEFKKIQNEIKKLAQSNQSNMLDNYVWSMLSKIPASVSRIRNTSIGELLISLSSGVEVDEAVRMFESMVAPANYKRPTALVTKSMIENAKNKIEELGLTSALSRRYAQMSDVSVNNVLFADRSAKKNMAGNVFDDLMATTPTKIKNTPGQEVSIDKFISDILPSSTSLEVMFDSSHTNNLVSLIAPIDPTAKNMFKWNNSFSWSYNGDMTDSIKERVKQAGGNVTGEFCCRLAWNNYDDLDFHMKEPNHHIYYGTKGRISPSDGMLDVDMNAGGGHTRTPVENIFYRSLNSMKDGTYTLQVNQYNQRETKDAGFEVEVDILGTVYRFVYDKPVKTGETINIASFNYSKKKGLTIENSMPNVKTSKTMWNISSDTFHKVNMFLLSPNHWDGHGIGNKHYFFMIDGCVNDDQARGFYNEFLREDLNPHRKVIEIVGSKMKTEETPNQLSGLGFSSTQRNSVLVKVDGSRIVKLMF
jgi:hypothetical protein